MYPCSCQARACARQLAPSHMDFNCGFWQMFVQPIAQFGAQGIWCHLLGVLAVSVRFWLSVFIRWIAVFPQVKLWPSVAVVYTWQWSQSPAVPVVTHGSRRHCSPVKSMFKFDIYCGLYAHPIIKFSPPKMEKVNSIIKTLRCTVPFSPTVTCRWACLDLILPDNRATGCCFSSQACWSPLRARWCFMWCQHSKHNMLFLICIMLQTFKSLTDPWWLHTGIQRLWHN